MTTNDLQDLESVQRKSHPCCVVCGRSNAHGLGLKFCTTDDGFVEAIFDCEGVFQGYPNMIHGGVICSLLDGAMTNCLFAHGWPAVTAELKVRFRHPIVTDSRAVVRARIESSMRPLHVLKAEIRQDDCVMATAMGKFVEMSNSVSPFGSHCAPCS